MPSRHNVELHADAAAFLAAAGPWLLAAEPDNNLVLAAARLLAGDDHPFRPPYFLAVVRNGGRVVGCAFRPPPDQLELTTLPPGAAITLVAPAAAAYPDLGAVAGPADTALEFARAWVAFRGGAWQIRHRWRLHTAERIVTPLAAPGALRAAASADWPLLAEWAPRYGRELNSTVDVTAFFARMLRLNALFVWDDSGPKSVVAISGRTPGGARLSALYTPDEHRRHGYGSNAAAAAMQSELDRGCRFGVVFADLGQLAPLRVYRALGFAPRRDHLVIDLV